MRSVGIVCMAASASRQGAATACDIRFSRAAPSTPPALQAFEEATGERQAAYRDLAAADAAAAEAIAQRTARLAQLQETLVQVRSGR